MTHFLQSPAWEAFQNQQGKVTHRRTGKGWSYLAIEERSGGVKRLYCPYGPTVTSEESLFNATRSLRLLAKQLGAAYVRLQPLGTPVDNAAKQKLGLRTITYSQPSLTWCIDLTQSTDDIIAAMKQNNRSVYRNYQKKDMIYSVSTDPGDIHHLTTLLRDVATHNQITVHSDRYFTDQAKVFFSMNAAKLHFISHDTVIIAAALTYEDDSTVYYAHAAADHTYRKLNASTALLAEIILHAKNDGKTTCDLYGITDSTDPTHRWAGFTRFKKSFGGYEKKLSHTFDFPVKKVKYMIYQTAKSIL